MLPEIAFSIAEARSAAEKVAPLIGTDQARGEDYLTLNIWRPAGGGAGLPVMVWIHGGGFVLGSKDAAVFDGSAFARDGVICIALNYRLGVEGFLPIPGVPTNLGLRDQIAALNWVRDHVASFGGDPSNVTAFGESAGGMALAIILKLPTRRRPLTTYSGRPGNRLSSSYCRHP